MIKDDMIDNMTPLSTGDLVEPQQGNVITSDFAMTSAGARGGGSGGSAGRSLAEIFSAEGLPKLYLVLFASLVLLIQAWIHLSQKPGDGCLAYALAVSIVSLGVTVLFLAYGRFKTDDFVTKTLKVRGHTYTVPQMFATFIAIWWTFGSFILTFYVPYYSVPSNAYIACWLGFVASALYAAGVHTDVENAFRGFSESALSPSLTALGGCVVAAAVVFFVSLGYTKFWTGSFALVTSIIDIVLAAFTYYCIDTKRVGPSQTKASAVLLVIMWALSIFFLTFDLDVENEYLELPSQNRTIVLKVGHMNGFTMGGNGFMATWAGMLSAFAFAYNEFLGLEFNMKNTIRRSLSLREHGSAMQHAEVV